TWTTVNAATTLGLASNGGSILINSLAKSGGTQTIEAPNNVTFTELTTPAGPRGNKVTPHTGLLPAPQGTRGGASAVWPRGGGRRLGEAVSRGPCHGRHHHGRNHAGRVVDELWHPAQHGDQRRDPDADGARRRDRDDVADRQRHPERRHRRYQRHRDHRRDQG